MVCRYLIKVFKSHAIPHIFDYSSCEYENPNNSPPPSNLNVTPL